PEIEARAFSEPRSADPKEYEPLNKEYYQWNPSRTATNDRGWLNPDQFDNDTELRDRVASGHGTIPTDNVGCFIRRAGSSAIVPGKHDFYFGPERLRELARFLASPPPSPTAGVAAPDQAAGNAQKAVQMLASNLIIKTTWIDPKPTQPPDDEKNSSP